MAVPELGTSSSVSARAGADQGSSPGSCTTPPAVSPFQSEPVLVRILVETGREATFPVFIRYLEQCRGRNLLNFEDSREAAETFLGLLLGDKQTQRLLVVVETSETIEIEARAKRAAIKFLRLYGGRRSLKGTGPARSAQ